MPQVRRGSARQFSSDSNPTTPADLPHPRVTFEQNRVNSNNSLGQVASPESQQSGRRPSHPHRHSDRDREESDAYYDSRAATQAEFRRRASNLQSYYIDHPDLLPQLPFTFRHGFKRWRLGGYIALMVIDACVIPIVLYYALTFGGNVQGWITFAVITAIWGGPTYVEFAVRSLRLIKKERFYKPLGVDKRWAFDITNWILVATIFAITVLLIVGAAPHIVFLRVLSMPGPAILYCIAFPIFLMSVYSHFGWKAPFQISSTAKGEQVLPGIYYLVEDIVAVNSGGGRPFREGWAARYNASPIFRKMLRDLSWFWSIPALLVALGCTVAICIHHVEAPIAYGIGWAVPFVWAAIWAAITVPWVRKALGRERTSWEEESQTIADTMTQKTAPPPAAHTPNSASNDRPSEASTTDTADNLKEGNDTPMRELSKREQRNNEQS